MSIYTRHEQKAQRKIEKDAAKSLLSLINDTCWGKKKDDGPRPVNVKKTILGALNKSPNVWLRRPTIKAIREHSQNEATYYFTGRRNNKGKHDYRTLLLIDIDCHKSGTLTGALAFAQHLADHYFPGLYFEPSTNGNGAHGYLIVEKPGWSERDYNKLLGKLEAWLKRVLVSTDYDVENVEIKGRCPVVTWTEEELPRYEAMFTDEGHWTSMKQVGTVKTRTATAIRVGTLAKLPRDLVTLYRDGTYETTANDLCILINQPVPGFEPEVPVATEGSCSGKSINTERIGMYMPIAEALLKDPAAVGGRVKVVAEDVAIFLTIVEYCSQNINSDGSMPYARIKAIWKALNSAEAINRAWDDKRFAYIRNLLSDNELIDWVENEYGPGKACRWALSQELLNQLGQARKEMEVNCSNRSTEHTHILGRNNLSGVQWVQRKIDENAGQVGPRPCQIGLMRPVSCPTLDEVEAKMGFNSMAA
jgi:hypothetical protein